LTAKQVDSILMAIGRLRCKVNRKDSSDANGLLHDALPVPVSFQTFVSQYFQHSLMDVNTPPEYRYPVGFVRGAYHERDVKAVVDVWCEQPAQRTWKEVADSALNADGPLHCDLLAIFEGRSPRRVEPMRLSLDARQSSLSTPSRSPAT
jgi:hypothetical protein